MPTFQKIFFFTLCIQLLASSGFADPSPHEINPTPLPTPLEADKPRVSRGFRLALSQQSLTASPFGNDVNALGLGFVGVYEFRFSPHFTMGIDLQWRNFSGRRGLNQMGYGLLMKHPFATDRFNSFKLSPYFEYGLLQNVSRQRNRPRSGSSHDTKLAFGVDSTEESWPIYFEASYHISRLAYFEQPVWNLDYLQFELGWRGEF